MLRIVAMRHAGRAAAWLEGGARVCADIEKLPAVRGVARRRVVGVWPMACRVFHWLLCLSLWLWWGGGPRTGEDVRAPRDDLCHCVG